MKRTVLFSALMLALSSNALGADLASSLEEVDNGHSILINEIESVTGDVIQDGTGKVYAIYLNDGKTYEVNQELSVNLTVKSQENMGATTRAFQNLGSNVVFNDKVSINLDVSNNADTGTVSSSAYDQFDNTSVANTQFNDDVYLHITGSQTKPTFTAALRFGGAGEINFNGDSSVLIAENYGYTAEGVNSLNAAGPINFKGGDVTIKAISDYGVNGIAAKNINLSNSGTFNVESKLTDGFGCNATGMDVDNLTVSNTVQALNISVIGAGQDRDGADGTYGLRVFGTSEINGQNLVISVESPDAEIPEGFEDYAVSYGIKNHKELTVGENTKTLISVNDSYGDAVGILSGGGETALSILGDLEVNVSAADGSRREAARIEDGVATFGSQGHVVNLNGDVSVATVDVAELHMAGQSTINGDLSITDKGTLGVKDSLTINGKVNNEGSAQLQNAYLSVDGDESQMGAVSAEQNSTIELGNGSYVFDSITSADNTSIVLNDLTEDSVNLGTKTGQLTRLASSEANDKFSDVNAASSALLNAFTDYSPTDAYEVREGDVNDGAQFGVDENGKIVRFSSTKNSKLDAYGSVAALAALSLRHEMNSLSKRMGDLRDAPEGVGVWVRGYGSEMEYGAQNLTMRSKSVQFGTDQSVGDWKVGIAFTYTDGDTTYDRGSADTKGYGVALYGTWFVPCGAYIDLIAKYNRLENDFALNGMDGDYNSNAYGVSVETGYRFEFLEGGLYVEPQVGFNYGHIEGETIKTSNEVRIDQDNYDSMIARAGLRAGFKFPENKGTIYARVSGLYDFDGELNGMASKGVARNSIEEDLGGAWFEMGVGANFNWTPNTYTYVDFERTNGGDVKENYRWNVGIRHTF